MISFFVNIFFALFLGINVWGYVSQHETVKSGFEQDSLQGVADDIPLGSIIDSYGSFHDLLSRSGRNELGSRNLLRMAGPWSGLLHGSMPVASRRRDYNSPEAFFSTPKEYYVYTLERMLC